MKILFFTEISPFPIHGGERIRSYGLLKALSILNYKVTAFIQNSDKVDLDKFKLRNIDFIEYEDSKQSFFELLFFKNIFFKNEKVIQFFEEIITKQKVDLAILDFNLAGRYSTYFKTKGIPVIIGTHNAESNLIWQKPSKSLFHYFRKIQHYISMYVHERIFYKNANALITVSNEDTCFHAKFFPEDKIFMIPNFLDESFYNQNLEREDYYVMTANFGAYMNFEGLKWLVFDVWNEEIDFNNKLYLVGKNSIESLEQLKKIRNFKNIEAIGMVDDVTPYIAKAKAVFIPLLHGSGSRLKCLEAMALKTPIIGTSKGVEGVKSDNIIIANGANKFRHEIKAYKYNPDIGPKLYEEFMNHYSLKVNIKNVQDLIEHFIVTD